MNKKEKQELKKHIIGFLKKQKGRKFKSKVIARELGIKTEHYRQFRDYLRSLTGENVLAKSGRNAYGLFEKPALEIGTLQVKSQGYGFVRLRDRDQEIFISQRNMCFAFDGDLVAVQLFAQSKGGKLPEGRVDHVVEKKRKHIVGTYREGKYFNYVAPDALKIPWDVIVPGDFSPELKPGQKVVVTIDSWEDRGLNPSGKIVEILGFPDQAGVDISSVLYNFNLPVSFPKAVEKEALGIDSTITEKDLENRCDFRHLETFTIDPDDAKDFDDAVSLETLDDGTKSLGIHIADVSSFIKEGSKLDTEALKRATSVYLVDRVIPMLPENLSNKICSLQPDQDRLTFSIIIKMDSGANVLEYRITPSIIRSKRRFSYESVMDILDSGTGDYVEELTEMRKLSKILFQRRIQSGGLDFETGEIKIKLDEDGKPVGIQRKKRLESHRLVEEFMLLANRLVAEYVTQKLPFDYQISQKLPFIYRIHERPSPEKITNFANLVRSLGFNFKPGKRIQSNHLVDVLKQVEGLPEEDIINKVMLRSLMKAKYDSKNIGHFGLAFKHYTHFTSPIRRYPDLMVHRLLRSYSTKPEGSELARIKKQLPKICTIASDQESNAQEAERQSIKIKQTEFMADKLGEDYAGIISGIVAFGIFVEIVDFLVDGLVHVKDLTSDYYIFDEPNYRLIGKTTGRIYRLGDQVTVKVVRVVPEKRIIDFKLVEDPAEKKYKKRNKSASKSQRLKGK